MKNQVLSINQMQHLKNLGVDTSKASMVWGGTKDWQELYTPRLLEFDVDADYIIEAFTLQDMLEMMPKKIMIKMENDFCRSEEAFFLEVSLNICNDNWQCGYIHFSKREDYLCYKYENTNLLTCTYEALCWLAENKHIGGEK